MTMRDHIHLDVVLTGAPEYAPQARYSVKFGELDLTPTVPAVAERGILGDLHVHALLDESGLPRQFDDHGFRLIVPGEELPYLKTMLGRVVSYCSNDHPQDGQDHWPWTKQVLVTTRRGGMTNIDPVGQYWLVLLELQEL